MAMNDDDAARLKLLSKQSIEECNFDELHGCISALHQLHDDGQIDDYDATNRAVTACEEFLGLR